MKQKQIIALVSATALVATALAGCGKTSEENTLINIAICDDDLVLC